MVPSRRTTIITIACTAAIALGAAGCAKTTIDTSVTTEPSVQTTTTIPSGTAAELLPRLVTEAGKLSDAIGNNDHKGQQMAIVNNLWTGARPAVAAADGVAASSFDAAIEMCRRGAKFNRPADADKCFRNLTALTDAFLAANP